VYRHPLFRSGGDADGSASDTLKLSGWYWDSFLLMLGHAQPDAAIKNADKWRPLSLLAHTLKNFPREEGQIISTSNY
jgi:hypothetical protein